MSKNKGCSISLGPSIPAVLLTIVFLLLKVFDKVGSISVGKKADFVVLDKDLSVSMTIVDGKIVYLA